MSVKGYENEIYVSVTTGLLMSASTYDGSTLIYRMSSSEPELTAPDEALFTVPDG